MDAPTIKRHQRAKVEVGCTLERFATRSPTTPEREVFATASLRSSLAQVVRFGRACWPAIPGMTDPLESTSASKATSVRSRAAGMAAKGCETGRVNPSAGGQEPTPEKLI